MDDGPVFPTGHDGEPADVRDEVTHLMENMEEPDSTRLDAFGYWLLYGVVTLGGAIGVCLAAGYALLLLPASPPLLAVVWFGGILALAAVPTITEWSLDATARVAERHLDTTATPWSRAKGPGADSQSDGGSGRVPRQSGSQGCTCCEC